MYLNNKIQTPNVVTISLLFIFDFLYFTHILKIHMKALDTNPTMIRFQPLSTISFSGRDGGSNSCTVVKKKSTISFQEFIILIFLGDYIIHSTAVQMQKHTSLAR